MCIGIGIKATALHMPAPADGSHIDTTTGPDWLDPAYDAAGNMTSGPRPGAEAGDADEEIGRLLRTRASTGRPLGDKAFVEKIGALLGRDLVPKKPGRKRKDRK